RHPLLSGWTSLPAPSPTGRGGTPGIMASGYSKTEWPRALEHLAQAVSRPAGVLTPSPAPLVRGDPPPGRERGAGLSRCLQDAVGHFIHANLGRSLVWLPFPVGRGPRAL